MATLLLVRHGETDWNRDHIWQGHTGPPLNDTGRQQAARLAYQISAIVAVYSSDTERAFETAVILAEPDQLEVHTDNRLREVNFGHWEGLTRAQIDAQFADGFSRWISGESSTPDGGESDEAMAERVLAALEAVAERHHDDDRVLVVTSGGPIRAAQAHLLGVDQALARTQLATINNCTALELVIQTGQWRAAAASAT